LEAVFLPLGSSKENQKRGEWIGTACWIASFMEYKVLADAYREMEKTSSRIALTQILSRVLANTPEEIIDKVVYLTQGKLYPDFLGIEIGVADKLAMKALAAAYGCNIADVSKLFHKVGDIGNVAEKLASERKQETLRKHSDLSVEKVYSSLDRMAKTVGAGSTETKFRLLAELLNIASPFEAKYLLRTVTGKLRLGVADYTVLDALAEAWTGSKANRPDLERAYNLCSDLGSVAKAVASKGLSGLKGFGVRVGRPIRPMLAERLTSAAEVLSKLGGKCAIEYKLDGERLQIHKNSEHVVSIFSRRLENITTTYPDAHKVVLENVSAKEVIVEAEAVAMNIDTGEYLPFQELMHRRRKYGIEEAMKQYPISVNFFDLLYADGTDFTGEPYVVRRANLEKIVKADDIARLVPAKVSSDETDIENYMEQAITDGCEGIVAKDLSSPYRAGARGFAWIKLKREYASEIQDTIDLVIVGAFYGRGRRAGRYGTYLLSAYDKDRDMFPTATKIGTGFSDEDLERFPKMLEKFQIDHRHPRVDSKVKADVWFEPSVVIETIASEITLSPIHTCAYGVVREGSGLALRFPKFTGKIRDDKSPEDATTVQEILELFQKQLKKFVSSADKSRVPSEESEITVKEKEIKRKEKKTSEKT
jgi:DNA ligase-1